MAGLDNGLLPFYHFGFCSRRSRLGGLDQCKGLLFWDNFFISFFVGDWWTGEGIRDGWMEIGDLGSGGGRGSVARFFFPKMQPTHCRLFSGTSC